MRLFSAFICRLVLLGPLLSVPFSVIPFSVAWADYIPPGDVSIQTANYQPALSIDNNQQYKYEISWQGIPVADALIQASNERRGGEDLKRVEVLANTGQGIDLLYRLRHRTLSEFKLNTYQPVRYSSRQTENSKERARQVSFGRNGKIRAKLFKDGVKEEVIEFQTANRTLDPVAAAFLARTLPIKVGEKFSFDVFNGKHRYLITFDVLARESLKEAGGSKRFAFKVVPEVKKLTDSKGEDRLKSATIWISDDDKREILRLESRVWIGSIVAKLVQSGPVVQVPLATEAKIIPPKPIIDAAALAKLGNP